MATNISFTGSNHMGEPQTLALEKELRLHGDDSTMASLQVGKQDILLTISDLWILSAMSQKLADELEGIE